MRHINEGLLHWYLDEAERVTGPDAEEAEAAEHRTIAGHLESCAECRGRLDEVRALRGRTGDILDRATPPVDRPLFEEVVARARRPQTRRWVGQLRRLDALGVAAVVVLAVGVAYVAREFTGRGEAERVATETAVTRRSFADAPDETMLEEQDADEAVGLAKAAAEGAGPGTATVTTTGRAAPAPPAEAPVELRAARARTAGEERVMADAVAPSVMPAPMMPADSLNFAIDALLGAVEPTLRQEAARADQALPGAAARSAWRPIDRESAGQTVGGELLVLSGAEIVTVERGEFLGSPTVRSVQRLPDGTRIDVLQWPSDDADAVANALAARDAVDQDTSVSTVTVAMNGMVVVVRGPLSADSLRSLVSAGSR